MVHQMDSYLGPPGMGSVTVAYTGVNGIRYPMLMLAAGKTGHKVGCIFGGIDPTLLPLPLTRCGTGSAHLAAEL